MEDKYYKENCLICGVEFITNKSNKVVCPGVCRKTANRLYAKEFMQKHRAKQKLLAERSAAFIKPTQTNEELKPIVI